MFRFLLPLFFVSLSGWAQEAQNPYDLLNSLDPASQTESAEYEDRMPASVEPGQIAVRKKLPDAKLDKTERTLQWEFLKNKPERSANEDAED